MSAVAVPAEVLARWSSLAGGVARPYGTGLINATFLVAREGARAIVQRMHPVFAPTVNDDIDAVTKHLARKGIVTTRVIPTDDGARWVMHDAGDGARPWRALTWIDHEHVFDKVPSPAVAREGAALVGVFHRAMGDFAYEYKAAREGVHDTPRHLRNLAAAVDAHPDHRLREQVAPLAEAVLAAAEGLALVGGLSPRHAHGDLKISNLLFDAQHRGVCLIDLDSVSQMPLPLELGDAMRSWCNPAGEDATETQVDRAVFRALVDGYASVARDAVTAPERDALVTGFAQIALELTARFLADALNERYFGWAPARFATRGEHNLVRARGQWSLHRAVMSARAALEADVRDAFRGAP